jgi:hypothetical protein
MTASEAPAQVRAYTPFVTDLTRLLRVPVSPGAVFEELNERPTFWAPWLVVSAFYVLIQLLMKPFNTRAGELMMQRLNRPAPPTTSSSELVSTITTVVSGPLTVLIMCAIAAGILYAIVAATGSETSYKKMLVLSLFAWPLALLQQALNVVVLKVRGVDAIASPQDLIVSMGLDNLLPQSVQLGNFLRFVLMGMGPLQIWSLIVTAVGITVLARAGKGAAWTAATINFVIILLLASGMGAFGMKMMGGG